jgi:protein-L-isoaspartate O-methyltransferase
VRQYESLSFEEVHREVLHLVPPPPSRILDIGAGSGRDAAALTRLGHTVTAVEPVAEFRTWGQRAHDGLGIVWVDDRLPQLAHLDGEGERFDVLLLSAVWMHLPAPDRPPAMERLVELLVEDGLIIMSLRHGPSPPGRQIFDVPVDEVTTSAQQLGLKVVHIGREPDRLGRAEVHWSRVVLQRQTE